MRRGIAVCAVLMVCVLGACGDKDPSTGSGSGSGGTKTTAPAKDASTPFDACKKLTPEEVSAILGGAATTEPVPGGGCTWKQDADVHAPTAGIVGMIGAGGGFDASKGGNVTDGKVEDLSGIGDGAWVAVGTYADGPLQGQGAVAVGDQLINISIIQGNGLSAAVIREMEVKLLTLCASRA